MILFIFLSLVTVFHCYLSSWSLNLVYSFKINLGKFSKWKFFKYHLLSYSLYWNFKKELKRTNLDNHLWIFFMYIFYTYPLLAWVIWLDWKWFLFCRVLNVFYFWETFHTLTCGLIIIEYQIVCTFLLSLKWSFNYLIRSGAWDGMCASVTSEGSYLKGLLEVIN